MHCFDLKKNPNKLVPRYVKMSKIVYLTNVILYTYVFFYWQLLTKFNHEIRLII